MAPLLCVAKTILYSLECVDLLDQDISLSKFVRCWSGAVLNNYRHSYCHQRKKDLRYDLQSFLNIFKVLHVFFYLLRLVSILPRPITVSMTAYKGVGTHQKTKHVLIGSHCHHLFRKIRCSIEIVFHELLSL